MAEGDGGAAVAWLGSLAALCSVAMILSPAPTVYQILEQRRVSAASPVPYLCGMANGLFWVLYGLQDWQANVVLVNLLCVTANACFAGVYAVFADPAARSTLYGWAVGVAVPSAAAGLLIANLGDQPSAQHQLTGIVATLVCVAMFASPLAAVRTVLAVKKSDSIDPRFTAGQGANCLAWAGYGLLRADTWLVVPNMLGLALAVGQAYLLVRYPRSHKAGLPV